MPLKQSQRVMILLATMPVLLVIQNWTGIPAGVFVIGTAAGALLLLLLSELNAWRQQRWQFSLRTLLIAMTGVAVIVGMYNALT